MDKRNLKFIFIISLSAKLITVGNTGTVQQIYTKDNKPAVKGGDVQIVCDISEFSSSDVIIVYKTESEPPAILTDIIESAACNPTICIGNIERHTFSSDSSKVSITVTNLNRSEDQKWWTCATVSQRKTMHLIVYTFTPTLQYDNPLSQDQDLVQNSVTLKCRTGCAYPSPSFTWYFIQSDGSPQQWLSAGSDTSTADDCTDLEKIYSSTLSLARYTEFRSNTDITVKFQCGAVSITGVTDQLLTSSSVNIRFAVRVTSVNLKDGNTTPSSTLEVTSGKSETLTCTTSASRPTATVIWYIGNEEKKRAVATTSRFTFTPDISDHGKQVYCKAFNLQQGNQAVSSSKSSLYVKVLVTSVTLKDGNTVPSSTIEVTSGESKTLTCTTSASRPTASIIWYIGNEEKKRSDATFSSLTFTPDNSDHGKHVYCKAFNLQSENQAVSSKRSSLYVKVLATTPTITYKTGDKLVVLEGDLVNFECTSSQTRPVATVNWKLNSLKLRNVRNTNNSHTGGLQSMTSVVTFRTNRTDNNKMVYCETVIPGQTYKPTAQERITVYWPPSTPSIPTANFPFKEGQTGKSIYCYSTEYGNPVANATWNKIYGTPDLRDSRKLNFPVLTYQFDGSPVRCQLHNQYTQMKGLHMLSQLIHVHVEYTPIIQIMEGNHLIQTITRNEGQTLSVICNVSGNPIPSVEWIGQEPRSPNLSFDDIDRTADGKYTCRASATSTKHPYHNFIREKEITVGVNYAPDVSVDLDNETLIENKSLRIICKPNGRPDKYHYTSFVQRWGILEIPNTHIPSNGVIEIESLQLQDSGTYICTVNNGVPDRKQQLDQRGKNTVKIKASPKLLLTATERKFAGTLGKSFNITVPFYSDPPIHTVQFTFQNGTLITNSIKYKVSYVSGSVKDVFYGQEVVLDGYIARLEIKDEVESDFVNYTFVLDNSVGSSKAWILEHISESKPSIPLFFNFTGLVKGVPTFNLVGGFNGGHLQTFVIETAEAGTEKWVEQLRFDETDGEFLQAKKLAFKFNITGLPPNIYDVRVLTGNVKGWIAVGDAPTAQFTLERDSDQQSNNSPSQVAAIAGGVCSAVVVFVVLLVAVALLRRRLNYKDGSDSETAARQRDLNENAYYNTQSSTYESLGRGSEVNEAYSSITSFSGKQMTDEEITYENLRLKREHI